MGNQNNCTPSDSRPDKWLEWLFAAEQSVCNHVNGIEDDSVIGPESGVEEFYCKKCGWAFRHVYF